MTVATDLFRGGTYMSNAHAAAEARPVSMRGTVTSHIEAVYHRSTTCEACSLRPGCLPRLVKTSGLAEFSTLARLKRKVQRGRELFRAGAALTSLYVVRSGTFKMVTVSHDGRPKITGFYLTGDLMGLEAISGGVSTVDAVTLEDSEVCILPVAQLEDLASRVPELMKELIRVLSAEISRDNRLTTLLGCLDAEHRVVRFFTNLADRYARLGYARDALLLHMTRDDIASYLGLATETVSRVISRLARSGVLNVHQRHVEFNDCAGLAALGQW